MKKILTIISLLFFISSCNSQDSQDKVINHSGTGITEKNISKNIDIIPDEIFINSEENKQNKANALECIKKIHGKDNFFSNLIIQAFEYNGNCFYITYGNYINKAIITDADFGNPFKHGLKDFTRLVSKIDDTNNDYLKECVQDYPEFEVNVLNNYDNIFHRYNIVPPRIIYTQEELKEGYFYGIPKGKGEEDNDKGEINNFKNILNNYFIYKNASDYEDLKNTFEKANQFLLKKYLEGLAKLPKNEPKCYFFTLDDKEYTYIKEIQNYDIYNTYKLDNLRKIKKELDKKI